jgi:transcription elongation factor Elf1
MEKEKKANSEKHPNRCGCDECESAFERNIERMVDEVEVYSEADHELKEDEVTKAFEQK